MDKLIEKRLTYEQYVCGFTNSRLVKHNKYKSTLYITHLDRMFIFQINDKYPFSPPVDYFCNGKSLYECSGLSNNCYACKSLICNRTWSPSILLKSIIDDYNTQLRESNLVQSLTVTFRNMLPCEIVEHICTFIF